MSIYSNTPWQPSASLKTLRQRADILSRIRNFFSERGVLEVETPLLSHATVTDPHIQSMSVRLKKSLASKEAIYYLQTSPEYAMKRLLAMGSGSIYQITKAFRQDQVGRLHQPEFTMLEWYRTGFDHHALMNEIEELLHAVFQLPLITKQTVAQIYEKTLGIDPHTADACTLMEYAKRHVPSASPLFTASTENKNFWLDLLFTHCIEPSLGNESPIFIYDFPISQAALAKIRPGRPPVASRFELYFQGVELANGFHELQNAQEQRKRFENDLTCRAKNHSPSVPIDMNFLAALEHGLPDCAGVAVGLDRLIMLALRHQTIAEVISFA